MIIQIMRRLLSELSLPPLVSFSVVVVACRPSVPSPDTSRLTVVGRGP
jgi:hypothetical protein